MAGGQKSVQLILSRELASNLATPMFLIDADGMLVHYNEAAEHIVGEPFSAKGEMPATDWGDALSPRDPKGRRVRRSQLPPGIAFLKRRPAHAELTVTLPDGRTADVACTAIPLFSRTDTFAGVVTMFWER